MAVTEAPRVSKADLGDLLKRIADGGLGEVSYAGDYRLASDPDDVLAYKHFTRDHADQAMAAEAAVCFRAGLPADERAVLDRISVWPRALVTDDDGDVCGLLMPLLPPPFFRPMIDDQTGEITDRPCEMQWLVAKDRTLKAAKIKLPDVDRTQRLFLLAQLTYAIGWLHRRGWVFGDLSLKNVAFAIDPPRIMLLDCDGTAELANTNRKQFSTAFWDPPECPFTKRGEPPNQQNDMTDAYKLGLAILRCLNPGEGASNIRNPPSRFVHSLDAEGMDLLAKALSSTPDERPTAKVLYAYLHRIVSPLVLIPEVISAEMPMSFRLIGQSVRIDWRMAHATKIVIKVGDHYTETVRYADHPLGYDIKPDESGQVRIEVRNKFGRVKFNLGELTLYRLPDFMVDLNHLPDPQIADIEAFSIEPLATALTGRDGMRLSLPEPPVMTHIGDPPELAWTRLDTSIVEVSDAMNTLIVRTGVDYVAALRRTMTGGGDA